MGKRLIGDIVAEVDAVRDGIQILEKALSVPDLDPLVIDILFGCLDERKEKLNNIAEVWVTYED